MPVALRLRARRVRRALTRRLVARDLSGDWLIVALGAVIGAGAGFVVLAFYGLVDRVRAVAGWASDATGSWSIWVAVATVPLGTSRIAA